MRQHVETVTIKDCDVDTYRGSGAGGQHRNKTDTGVRIVHTPSGAVGQSCDTRSQLQNKRLAFRRMALSPAFQRWVRRHDAVQPEHTSTERIRTYNLVDRRVVDHRTGAKTSAVERVMDGELDLLR